MSPPPSQKRRILVTAALPYANGHIHLGHIIEYTQADIWARFQRLAGNRCLYICADDTHGTSIMMRARQEGRSEEDVIRDMSEAHQRDFAGFQIEFDNYGSTNSPANRKMCDEVWAGLQKQGLVSEKEVTQLFDPKEGIFLADRFVTGTCPKCGATGQYGDSCDKCGATYSATDLIDPKSTLSGATPEVRKAPHLFVRIESLHGFLDEWTQAPGHLQPPIANYLKGYFLNEPLRDWDVSRPAPYFGFEIPGAKDQFWYVWFDAPIGYMASTLEWCDKNGESFDNWWRSDEAEIFHVIGKDIVYFHTLFWPAMLKASGFSLPRHVHVHGFLTVNGEKMSKRRGTFVLASTYLEHLDPAYLRYYYASKLGTKADDLDLNLDELVNKVNSDLVGKVVNLASRSARFLSESGLSASYPDDEGLFAQAAEAGEEIAAAYEGWDFAKAMRLTLALADRANEYFDRKQPWALKKQAGKEAEVQDVCTVAINLYRQIAIYLAPVLPQLAKDSGALLGASLENWSDAKTPLAGTKLAPFQHLMQRVDPKKVEAIVAASTAAPVIDASSPATSAAGTAGAESALIANDDDAAIVEKPLSEECTIDDFGKVDLRVARILSAEHVPEARKLLKLTVSLGGDRRLQIFAGIKSAYEPEALVGRLVVVVANLKPRKMKFGMSEGMVIASSGAGEGMFLLSPDDGAKPGQRVS